VTHTEKSTPAGLASTACLPKLHGVAMLKRMVGARSTILEVRAGEDGGRAQHYP